MIGQERGRRRRLRRIEQARRPRQVLRPGRPVARRQRRDALHGRAPARGFRPARGDRRASARAARRGGRRGGSMSTSGSVAARQIRAPRPASRPEARPCWRRARPPRCRSRDRWFAGARRRVSRDGVHRASPSRCRRAGLRFAGRRAEDQVEPAHADRRALEIAAESCQQAAARRFADPRAARSARRRRRAVPAFPSGTAG